MEDRPNRLLFDMRRSLFLLIAAIVAFLRIFIIGIVAILFGMSDYGGVTSALLRIFQLYNLLFVYIVLIQYIKAGAREYLRKPSLIVACVSPILSVLALLTYIRNIGGSFPVDMAKAATSMITLILLDIVVLGLLVIDALKFKLPEAKKAENPENMEKTEIMDKTHKDQHEVS
ncbi:MAG TPA: hypothetical protein PKY65_05255 [Rectinema sp.]|nr:hypothetical protein [Rectinema sp.]